MNQMQRPVLWGWHTEISLLYAVVVVVAGIDLRSGVNIIRWAGHIIQKSPRAIFLDSRRHFCLFVIPSVIDVDTDGSKTAKKRARPAFAQSAPMSWNSY